MSRESIDDFESGEVLMVEGDEARSRRIGKYNFKNGEEKTVNRRISDVGFFTVGAVELAKKLLGCYLCRVEGDFAERRKIIEVEAYVGDIDSACHAYKGRTNKNRALFEEGGRAYVHICYGIHFMFNIVSGEKGRAEGVLIRSVEGATGPGNVTKKLRIDKDLYLEDLTKSSRIWLEWGEEIKEYETSKRIGLGKVKQEDKDRLWRFVLKP